MEDFAARAVQLRAKAQELRAIAATYSSPELRAQLEAMADDYDRMALNLERVRLAENKPRKGRRDS